MINQPDTFHNPPMTPPRFGNTTGVKALSALLSLLLLGITQSISIGSEDDKQTPALTPVLSGSPEPASPVHKSLLEWDEDGDYEDFTPAFQPDTWDSVMAAYDAVVAQESHRRISPEFGLRYTKAEGFHLEGGLTLGWRVALIRRLTLIAGYDTGRERPAAMGELEIPVPGHEGLSLWLEGQSEIRPFGNHSPYGTTLMALIAGYDAGNYMDERKGAAGIAWSFDPDSRIRLGWNRMRQTPVDPVTDWRLFGSDSWMAVNEQADPVTLNGIGISFMRQPMYISEASVRGLILDAEASVYGGSILGGSREYGRLSADLWYTRPVRSEDTVQLRGAATLATGRAPRQALGDLGGSAGLKAFPPRGHDTPDTLVGTSRIFGRLEYRLADMLISRTTLPVVRDLNLTLVPFIEGGAVWGDGPVHRVSDLCGPRGSDFLWDLGFGLRRSVDLSGILSYVQIDFAWPMGHRRGPVRIGVTLSEFGLD